MNAYWWGSYAALLLFFFLFSMGIQKELNKKFELEEGQILLTASEGDEVGSANINGITFEKEGTRLLYIIPNKEKQKKGEGL